MGSTFYERCDCHYAWQGEVGKEVHGMTMLIQEAKESGLIDG